MSPGVSPAEPLARVAFVKPAEPKPAAGEVFYGGPVIRRLGIGQVLAVH